MPIPFMHYLRCHTPTSQKAIANCQEIVFSHTAPQAIEHILSFVEQLKPQINSNMFRKCIYPRHLFLKVSSALLGDKKVLLYPQAAINSSPELWLCQSSWAHSQLHIPQGASEWSYTVWKGYNGPSAHLKSSMKDFGASIRAAPAYGLA